MLGVNGGDNINRLRYSGTNSYYDRFHNAFAAGMLCYNFQTQKISLYADAGVCWEGSDINGEKYNDTYPFTHINLRFSPNSKNAFSAYSLPEKCLFTFKTPTLMASLLYMNS